MKNKYKYKFHLLKCIINKYFIFTYINYYVTQNFFNSLKVLRNRFLIINKLLLRIN